MAKAKLVNVVEPDVELTLSHAEAVALFAVLELVAGSTTGPRGLLEGRRESINQVLAGLIPNIYEKVQGLIERGSIRMADDWPNTLEVSR